MKKIGILVSVILLILCTAGCVHTENSKKQETSNLTHNIDKYRQVHGIVARINKNYCFVSLQSLC